MIVGRAFTLTWTEGSASTCRTSPATRTFRSTPSKNSYGTTDAEAAVTSSHGRVAVLVTTATLVLCRFARCRNVLIRLIYVDVSGFGSTARGTEV